MNPIRPTTAPSRVAILSLIILLATAVTARAVSININAQANATGSPVSLALGAGTWVISPTNPTLDSGATYTAWSAWDNGAYWLNSVTIFDVNAATYYNFSVPGPGYAGSYATAQDAFNAIAGQTLSITLTTPGTLDFFVGDNIPGDNRGGISLEVSAAVPDSGSLVALLGLGLLFIAGARRWLPVAQ